MFGGPGGAPSFLNLGAPEVVVIGAVAWAILGPKELFRLVRQAGEFVGEWQQLGLQAKQQFTDALEAELAEDERKTATSPAATDGTPTSPFASSAQTGGELPADYAVPPLSEYAASERTAESDAALRESLYDELGEPGANAANFGEQISGARNARVLEEYPATLEGPAEGSPMAVQSADEALLETQIAQAENELATLRAEQQVLALKRQQLQANAERAREMAEERAQSEAGPQASVTVRKPSAES